MVRPEDLKALRDQQPFVPFRTAFSGGGRFDIPHRDFWMVSKPTIEIALTPDPVTDLPGRVVHGSPRHVVRVDCVGPTAQVA